MILNLIRKLLSALRHRIKKSYQTIQSLLIAVITDKYWLLDWVPTSRPDIHSVMLVRLDVIGDFVLWLDSVRAYRQLYPQKKIVLYANASWVELAKELAHWDEVVSIDMVKLRVDERYRLHELFKIRRRGFSIAIHPTYSREYMADLLIRSSGAEEIIGFDCDLSNISPTQKVISDSWYSTLIKTVKEQRMELTRNADFIRSLGLKDFVSDVPKISPLFDLPKQLQIKAPYAIIFPGASWGPKMWPAKNFAELINILDNDNDLLYVLCGSAQEIELCKKIIQLSGNKKILNFAGITNLTELVEVIRYAQFLIANDTSAIHIATAVETPSVCILGGGHYGRFLPYQIESTFFRIVPQTSIHYMSCFSCNWSCIHIKNNDETVPCIENINVEKVLTQYLKTIKYRKNENN